MRDLSCRDDRPPSAGPAALPFPLALEAAPVGIACLDVQGVVRAANDALLLLAGLPRAAIEAGQVRWIDLLPVAAAEVEESVIRGEAQLLHPPPWEAELRRGDGRTLSVLVCGGPSPGHPGESVAFVVELPSRMRAEQRTRAQLTTARILAAARTPAEAAPRLLRPLAWALGGDGALFWLAEDGVPLRLLDAWFEDDLPAEALAGLSATPAGVAERCRREQRPCWIEALPREADAHAALLGAAGLHTALAVPIVCASGVLGVLEFVARQAEAPDEALLATLHAVAAQLSQFLERCRSDAERLVAQREQQMLLDRLQRHLERMPLACNMTDEQMRYTYWNPAAERLFGWSNDEVRGRRPFEVVVPPEAHAFVAAALERLRDDRGAVTGRNENLTRDGRRIVCDWTGTALHDADGRFIGIASLAREVTDRVQLEESLQRSEARYRGIVETMREGMCQVDAGGRISFVNPRLAALLGRPAEHLLGQPFLDHVAAEDRGRAGSGLHQPPGGEPGLLELRLAGAGGTLLWTLVSVSPLDDGGALLLLTDITGHRLLQQQLAQTHKMEALGRLAGGIAHDFNNLLTVITGYSQLLQAELPPDSPPLQFARQIDAASERATALIHQLLAFGRHAAQAPHVVDLNSVLRDSELMIVRLIGEDITLSYRLLAAPALVRIDPGQLNQVILNLAANARDAMPRGGGLTIETRTLRPEQVPGGIPAGGYVVLDVRDTGGGIDEATQARLFEPFFTTKEIGKGTGMGLAIVYGILQAADGHIRVASQPGRGTTFSLYLPLAATEARPAPAAMSATPGVGRGETILLVEDEDELRELLRRVLLQAGYRVQASRNAAEALIVANGEPIDLLVTDVVMPGLSGRQLAEVLRGRDPTLKVIYLSGYTDDDVLRRGLSAVEVAFLQKPFAPDDLTRLVRSVLDSSPTGRST